MRIEQRIEALSLDLPAPIAHPPDVPIRFHWVRVRGGRVYVSGHGPLNLDGTMAEPIGQVGTEVTLAQAQDAARLTALAVISSLKAALGDLDRISAWLTVSGFVNAAPEFPLTTAVINAFSDGVLDVFGPEVGAHARTAIGAATTPFRLPVIVAAEIEIDAEPLQH